MIDGRPLMRASDVSSFSPSIDVGHLRQVDRPAALLRDDDAAELRGILDLALDAHDAVALRRATGGPAGTSWFAARIALITWSTPMPSAVSACGLICTRICRVTLP